MAEKPEPTEAEPSADKTKKTTTISLKVTSSEREAIQDWTKLLSFKSQSEMVRFFLFIGMMTAEMMSERPLTAESFASALYTIGTRFWQAEFRPDLSQTVEDFRTWQKVQPGLERTYSPTRKLSPTK